MKENLLEILRCPDCRGNFEPTKTHRSKDDITSGLLECTGCSTTYPIEGGIPRILSESDRRNNYNRNFEYYWLRMNWHRPQMNKERFYQLTEWRPEDIRDKVVLDAGCGGGRWLYQFAQGGAKEVVAFDYTRAVERAADLCRSFENIHYVQTDIFRMPFPDNIFDVVHCHGVLMATPDPRKGVDNLSRKVKEGGELAILLYRNLTKPQKVIDESICAVTKRLPTRVMYWLTIFPTLIEYVPGAVPLFENIVHLSGQPDFTLKHLHNFDWYTCEYRHRNSPNEVKGWLQHLGFEYVKILNTNDFRIKSRFPSVGRIKGMLLEKGFFLKGTLGVRARKLGRHE